MTGPASITTLCCPTWIDGPDGHAIYYAQRGWGMSADGVEPDDITMESEVEDLDAVRRSLGLDAVALIGHSWGGFLAMYYALA